MTEAKNGIIANFSFGQALGLIKEHPEIYMRLPKWSPDVKIKIQRPDDNSKMTAPYLYVESRFGKVPWTPTQIELLAEDWECGEDA